jgi:cytosine/adenosine deaminase-related metal-dependent hydrolase
MRVRTMSADVRTLTARWVFPASSPPLDRGTVTVRGEKIEAVEPHGLRTADEDLGNVALIPGLVNAHTHLDLSGARGLIPPTDPDHFTDWLKGVIAYRRGRSEADTLADIEAGLAECLRCGTTLIGDIASEGKSWDAVSAAKTRAVVFHEFIGMSVERAREFWFKLQTLGKTCPPTPTTRAAVSPHAPYSVRCDQFRSLAWNGWQMTTHVAESPAEVELVASKSGPFEQFLRDVGAWEPGWVTPSFDWLLWRTRRSPSVLFAHCNYLPATAEIWSNQSVVYCPRTHAAFGHPPHPFRDFLARGVRVCLGTDSLASNPDLDILAEARFVHAKYPDFPGEQLLKMVTLSGAEALGWADECGSLEPGKSADVVVVPLADVEGDPHELLFANTPGDRRTMWRGEWR